jgi:hypothetical protein
MFYDISRTAGEFFALKELSLDPTSGARRVEAAELIAEIAILSELKHQHIVRYIGTQRTPEKLYLFTEFVAGAFVTLSLPISLSFV